MLLILSLLAANAAGAEPLSSSQAEDLFGRIAAANATNIARFLELPCVSPEAKGIVSELQQGTAKAQAFTESEHKTYMDFVTKSMEGNGRCDGGFQSVVQESGRRVDRTVGSRQRVNEIQRYFQNVATNRLFAPDIALNSAAGLGCMKAALDLYGALETGAKKFNESLETVQQSLAYEEKMFRQYQATNDALRVRCGEKDAGTETNRVIRSSYAQGALKPIPTGQSRNPASSITGVQEDAAKRAKAQ